MHGLLRGLRCYNRCDCRWGKVTCDNIHVSGLGTCCVPWEFPRWFSNGFVSLCAGSKITFWGCGGGNCASGGYICMLDVGKTTPGSTLNVEAPPLVSRCHRSSVGWSTQLRFQLKLLAFPKLVAPLALVSVFHFQRLFVHSSWWDLGRSRFLQCQPLLLFSSQL
ncbi:uncharacterized protein G2W53_013825 [Senna tora]|uniref:Uncharacterized protein n=1 Tax=Senna tora TaxID=362788 RepID=A0A834U170_9FABA|nr:uncharacterized protein G2W53_013825 [Senna tora]